MVRARLEGGVWVGSGDDSGKGGSVGEVVEYKLRLLLLLVNEDVTRVLVVKPIF
jgi:hypothetical protein